MEKSEKKKERDVEIKKREMRGREVVAISKTSKIREKGGCLKGRRERLRKKK